ncbi:MAG: prephenate dehydratase domain-containing protein, partial [bacterium]
MSTGKKILALGPAGTNGHEAAKQAALQLGWADPEVVFCDRNVDILKRLSGGEAESAVVPIENGQSGLVVETTHG